MPRRSFHRQPATLPSPLPPWVQLAKPPRRPRDLNEIFEAYIRLQHRRGATPLTVKAFTHGFRRMQRWLDEHNIEASELTLFDCEEYFAQLIETAANGTARQHLAYIRAAYRYGLRHGLVAYDPTGDVKLPWPPDHEPATYTNTELRQIHAAIRSDREELAFHLFAFAGLRLSEATRLTWEQIDLQLVQMKFNGKGGKFRLVPLHPALEQLLHEHAPRQRSGQEHLITKLNGQPISPEMLGRGIRGLVDRAGVQIDSPTHAFRRTVATTMYEQGVRTRVIERIMGWAPRLMHERHYLRVADKPMREAIDLLYRDDPISPRQTVPSPTDPPPALDLSVELALLDQLESRYDISFR